MTSPVLGTTALLAFCSLLAGRTWRSQLFLSPWVSLLEGGGGQGTSSAATGPRQGPAGIRRFLLIWKAHRRAGLSHPALLSTGRRLGVHCSSGPPRHLPSPLRSGLAPGETLVQLWAHVRALRPRTAPPQARGCGDADRGSGAQGRGPGSRRGRLPCCPQWPGTRDLSTTRVCTSLRLQAAGSTLGNGHGRGAACWPHALQTSQRGACCSHGPRAAPAWPGALARDHEQVFTSASSPWWCRCWAERSPDQLSPPTGHQELWPFLCLGVSLVGRHHSQRWASRARTDVTQTAWEETWGSPPAPAELGTRQDGGHAGLGWCPMQQTRVWGSVRWPPLATCGLPGP